MFEEEVFNQEASFPLDRNSTNTRFGGKAYNLHSFPQMTNDKWPESHSHGRKHDTQVDDPFSGTALCDPLWSEYLFTEINVDLDSLLLIFLNNEKYIIIRFTIKLV